MARRTRCPHVPATALAPQLGSHRCPCCRRPGPAGVCAACLYRRLPITPDPAAPAPTLVAYTSEHGECCVSAWCPHCQRFHSHGASGRALPPIGGTLGIYSPHCPPGDSPYRAALAYELIYAGPWPGKRKRSAA